MSSLRALTWVLSSLQLQWALLWLATQCLTALSQLLCLGSHSQDSVFGCNMDMFSAKSLKMLFMLVFDKRTVVCNCNHNFVNLYIRRFIHDPNLANVSIEVCICKLSFSRLLNIFCPHATFVNLYVYFLGFAVTLLCYIMMR